MKILISGGSGLIGSELILSLLKAGDEVKAVAREPLHLPFLPTSAVSKWELEKTPLDPQFIQHQDAIVHLAGSPVAEGRWTRSRKKEIVRSRVVSTREWFEALNALPESARPRTFVCASAIGFYGDRGDELLTEGSARGEGFLSDVVLEWETEARKIETLGIRVVSVRTGIVLSRLGGALTQMKPVVLGKGSEWMSWIHHEDEVALIRFVLEKKNIRGVLNLTSPNPVTNFEFAQSLAKIHDVSFVAKAPAAALKLALGEMADMILSSQRVLPTIAEKEGFEFKYPKLKEALDAIYEEAPPQDSFFRSAQFVPGKIDAVFDFFSDAKNLESLTPPWLKFHVLSQSTPAIEEGTLIDYELKIHGVPVKWTTRIEVWADQKEFVDEQLKGPYRKWHHHHRFYPVKDGTLIVDEVQYRLPVGQLGKILAGKFVSKDVSKIFEYRTNAIRERFHE